MKSKFLRLVALITVAASLGTVIPFSVSAYENVFEFEINGFDCKTDTKNLVVYKNETNGIRNIKADDYNFRYARLLVFNAEGKVIEAGNNLFENTDTTNGSPQESVNIPKGGFMVAFKPSASTVELNKAYETVMEGAMLYNATMSVIYDLKGYVNGNTLKIEYNSPKEPSKDAKKFLFVGNSATYFNGTPIKFKGLAKAAGVEIDVDYSTAGSAYLHQFADANHNNGRLLRNKLSSEKYDYVVLQDAGGATYSLTKPAVDKILPLIKENGAEALLYMRYSGASNLADRLDGAETHHENYSQIAKDYSLNYSPVADAFCYCYSSNPEINLYADDNSHHSKEGSYLAACCFLMSYLGIDPRGNTYYAELDESVAKTLQGLAYLACTEEYDYKAGPKDIYTDKNGDVYENIAVGKEYTVVGTPYTAKEGWSDTDENGNPLGKLTNGKYASSGDDGEIGAYSGSNHHTVTIDLGNIASVRAIKTDLFGNEGWGIPGPHTYDITVSISTDGVNYMDIGNPKMQKITSDGDFNRADYILALGSPVTARYVRLSYSESTFYWSSEISVYGLLTVNPDSNGSNSITEENNSQDFQENPNKNKAWLYWLLGIIAVVGTLGTAIIISKKKK